MCLQLAVITVFNSCPAQYAAHDARRGRRVADELATVDVAVFGVAVIGDRAAHERRRATRIHAVVQVVDARTGAHHVVVALH